MNFKKDAQKEMQLYLVEKEIGFWWKLDERFLPGAVLFVTNGDVDLLVSPIQLTEVNAKVFDLTCGDTVKFDGEDYQSLSVRR